MLNTRRINNHTKGWKLTMLTIISSIILSKPTIPIQSNSTKIFQPMFERLSSTSEKLFNISNLVRVCSIRFNVFCIGWPSFFLINISVSFISQKKKKKLSNPRKQGYNYEILRENKKTHNFSRGLKLRWWRTMKVFEEKHGEFVTEMNKQDNE